MRNGREMCVLACAAAISLWMATDAPAQTQVGTEFTYQGQLQEDAAPANGSYDLRFILYNSEVGGSQVGSIVEVEDVPVSDGLFQAVLDFGANAFVGDARWLEIGLRAGGSTGSYTTLSNRQPVTPAPYAIGLRPGAQLQQVATGTALQADSSDGIGFAGLGQVYGVYGGATGPQDGSGYGGYFESSTGIGVHGRSSASPSTQSPEAPGVHGWSQHGTGVLGESDASFGTGVRGRVATGMAVRGNASGGFGLVGISPAFAVRGHNSAPTSGQGYGGHFTSTTGTGVYGESTASPSTQNVIPAGVWGYSDNGAGVRGVAGSSFAWAGVFNGDVRINGDLTTTGIKSGYVVDVGTNVGAESLDTGDLVVIAGHDDPVHGQIPVVEVRQTNSAFDKGVVGVVDKPYVTKTTDSSSIDEIADQPRSQIYPGEVLNFVTLGSYKALNVDASYGAIAPGDLLVSSPNPGHAMRADNPPTGTVVGKAMGKLDAGTGTIPVMVTLH